MWYWTRSAAFCAAVARASRTKYLRRMSWVSLIGVVARLLTSIPLASSTIPTQAIDKEFVVYMQQTTMWIMEIDNSKGGLQTPLWKNPDLVAKLDDEVRFHILGMGNFFHTFHLHAHRWLDPGTTNVIDTKTIGPLENHPFVIRAGEGVGAAHWNYHCHVFSHLQAGMMGHFIVSETGGPSIPGDDPL